MSLSFDCIINIKFYIPLIAYSGDAVYLYSTRDEPQEPPSTRDISPILAPNTKKRKATLSDYADGGTGESSSDVDVDMTYNPFDLPSLEDISDDEDDESEDMSESAFHPHELPERFKAPQVFPRSRFAGACNVETIKDGEYHCLT